MLWANISLDVFTGDVELDLFVAGLVKGAVYLLLESIQIHIALALVLKKGLPGKRCYKQNTNFGMYRYVHGLQTTDIVVSNC